MKRVFGVLMLALATAFSAAAQFDRGTITGTVTDQSGAAVPGAAVRVTNPNTGLAIHVQSTDTGNYTAPAVPVGSYVVSIEHPGFRGYEQRGVTVQVAQTVRVNIVLEVGATTESITVTADAPLLKTESSEQSTVFSTENINALPLNFANNNTIRNPLTFATLAPGIAAAPWNGIKINGMPEQSYRIHFEGQDATNDNNVRMVDEMGPSVDAVEEFAVQTSNFSAEYGQVGGGLFNFTAKSGTNSFHGAAYLYWVNEALNSGMPFTDDGNGGHLKGRSRQSDYGFSLGGPIVRDKTFFFFNYERYRNDELRFAGLATLPTAANRAGDFGADLSTRVIGTDPLGRNIIDGQIFDPLSGRTVNGRVTRDPFANNRIPQSQFDAVAGKVQSMIPAVDPKYANVRVLNYEKFADFSRYQDSPSIKIDHNFGAKGHLAGYYAWMGTDLNVGAEGLPDPISARRYLTIRTNTARLNYDHTIRPTLLFHVGVGYQYYRNPDSSPQDVLDSFNQQTALGLKGAVINGFPRLNGLPMPLGPTNITVYRTDKPTANTSMTWVRGNHSFKFGGDWKIDAFTNRNSNNAVGIYNFTATESGQPATEGQNLQGGSVGIPYASFLLGAVGSAQIGNPAEPQYRRTSVGLYLQDDWKVTPKLTLNIGLRWDHLDPGRELHSRMTRFSFSTPNPAAGGLLGGAEFEGDGPGRCNCLFADTYKYGFGPRLGFAYQMDDKTVLRAGIGATYGPHTTFNWIAAGNSLGFEWNSIDFTSPAFGEPALYLANGLNYNLNTLYQTNLDPGLRPLPGRVNTNLPAYVDANAGRPPRVINWSIGIQRQLTPNLMVEAAYVANRAAWLRADNLVNYNALTPERLRQFGFDINSQADRNVLNARLNSQLAIDRGIRAPYAGYPLTSTVAQALRPYPQFTTVGSLWAPLGNSWYDSLQIKATQRPVRGLMFTASYTWSKNLATVNDVGGGGVQVNDVFDRAQQKTLSSRDQPHIFVAAIRYELPLAGLAGSSGFARGLLSGWELGGIVRYGSGYPIPVPRSNNALNSILFRDTRATRVEGDPLFLKDPNCGCIDPYRDLTLNPKAWTSAPAGQFGTAAGFYSDYRWQRRPDEQISLAKMTRLKEGMTLEIRAQFFNIFNRVNFLPMPTSANHELTTRINPVTGVVEDGFGRVDLASISGGQDRKLVDLPYPRTGQFIVRLRF